MKELFRKTIEVAGCYIGDPCYASTHASADDFYAEWEKKAYVDAADLGNKALIYGTGNVFPLNLRGDLGEIKHSTPLLYNFRERASALGVVNAQYATSRDEDRVFMLHIPNAVRVTMRVWERKRCTRCFSWTIVTKEPDGSTHSMQVHSVI